MTLNHAGRSPLGAFIRSNLGVRRSTGGNYFVHLDAGAGKIRQFRVPFGTAGDDTITTKWNVSIDLDRLENMAVTSESIWVVGRRSSGNNVQEISKETGAAIRGTRLLADGGNTIRNAAVVANMGDRVLYIYSAGRNTAGTDNSTLWRVNIADLSVDTSRTDGLDHRRYYTHRFGGSSGTGWNASRRGVYHRYVDIVYFWGHGDDPDGGPTIQFNGTTLAQVGGTDGRYWAATLPSPSLWPPSLMTTVPSFADQASGAACNMFLDEGNSTVTGDHNNFAYWTSPSGYPARRAFIGDGAKFYECTSPAVEPGGNYAWIGSNPASDTTHASEIQRIQLAASGTTETFDLHDIIANVDQNYGVKGLVYDHVVDSIIVVYRTTDPVTGIARINIKSDPWVVMSKWEGANTAVYDNLRQGWLDQSGAGYSVLDAETY
mgnify:CR=1 FL=1